MERSSTRKAPGPLAARDIISLADLHCRRTGTTSEVLSVVGESERSRSAQELWSVAPGSPALH